MRDSCRWSRIGGILRFHGGSPCRTRSLCAVRPSFTSVEVPRAGSRDSRRLAQRQDAPLRLGGPRHQAGRRPVRRRRDRRRRVSPRPRADRGTGLEVTLDHLGEDITDRGAGRRHPGRLPASCSTRSRPSSASARQAEVSVKLSALGAGAARRRPRARARQRPRRSPRPPPRSAPRSPSTWRTTPPSTRRWPSSRAAEDFPRTGAVIQAYLFRTEADSRRPRRRGSPGPPGEGRLQRARLGRLPGQGRGRQGLRALPEDPDGRATGYPMVGTPRPAADRDRRRSWPRATAGRKRTSYEFQMLYGIRTDEQRRLAAEGDADARLHRRTAPTGTATSCAASPSARPTSPSSSARSSPADRGPPDPAPRLAPADRPTRGDTLHGRRDPGPRAGQRAGALGYAPGQPGARPPGGAAQGARPRTRSTCR